MPMKETAPEGAEEHTLARLGMNNPDPLPLADGRFYDLHELDSFRVGTNSVNFATAFSFPPCTGTSFLI